MKISGFSFVKNAVRFEYPVIESIKSILPLCDEFIIAIGKCDDGTLELIQNINDEKIKIVETEWDDSLREGGKVLAAETNKALKHISTDSDWAFYIQADEVIHENCLTPIKRAMLESKDDKNVDGLLFKYLHFYGSFDYIGASSNWYSHEIRVIKNNANIYSYKDAQGFRKNDNEKLNVKSIDAFVYHYGWVREPEAMQRKQSNFGSLYRGKKELEKAKTGPKKYIYENSIHKIAPFKGSHPKIIIPRIEMKNWTFDYEISMSRISLKDRSKKILKKYFGIDTYYKNYKIVKR
ncbi:glycosyltransferase family 2 protein [Zobellia roscoffensis]|uniref:glycosyltransferase family 2 protein n=1 Tax=Zobellia roscoffensis TaxID=2779508 RepID=UPI00188C0519|nr:glycosyltransferase family 2 protein [Zobellia roscoffensis]